MKFSQLFVLGNPRSGTSMLRIMLDCHSQVSIPPECGFLLWLYPKYKTWRVNDINSMKFKSFISDLEVSKKFETWNVNCVSVANNIKSFKPDSYAQLSQCVYLAYASTENKMPLVLGDKNNYYINYLTEISEIFQNYYTVHIVRDGRDVVCSYLSLMNLESQSRYFPDLNYNIISIAKEWLSNNFRMTKYFEGDKRYVLVRYEDVIENPKYVLTDLLLKIDLKFEAKMTQFHIINKAKTKEPKELLDWKMKTLEPVDSTNKEMYKNILSKKQIKEFEDVAGEGLKYFGYDC